jgi:hypothetical protein
MPIIKNYGLRWLRDKVEWGSPGKGNSGRLRGKPAALKRSKTVDFRDQIGIYVLYESGFVPIYIGQAGNGNARLFARLRNHCNDHLRDRWTHFSWFGFRDVNNNLSLSEKQNPRARALLTYSSALAEIEGILIQVLEPRLNEQGPGWRQTAEEYVQAGLEDESVRISEVLEEIAALRRQVGAPR